MREGELLTVSIAQTTRALHHVAVIVIVFCVAELSDIIVTRTVRRNVTSSRTRFVTVKPEMKRFSSRLTLHKSPSS